MELAQYHSFERQSVDGVARVLRNLLRPEHLHRRADLGVTVQGPWRPADVWPGALERLVWSVEISSGRGPVLSAAGESALGRLGPAKRSAPLHPVEALAIAAGEGLVVVHSDAARLAYVAVYRQRHLAWSLSLEDGVRAIRCDGQVVLVSEPVRWLPEEDRVGVLAAGLGQWLREPLVLEGADRLQLPDVLASLTSGEEPVWLVRDGHWAAEQAPRRASAG